MTDDGQGFAYGAGYAEATNKAQAKIDALVAALRGVIGLAEEACCLRAASDDPEDHEMLDAHETSVEAARAALKAATE